MSVLEEFLFDLFNFMIGKKPTDYNTLIKIHTRSLNDLGDFSFPILLKNWYQLIDNEHYSETEHIFNYKLRECSPEIGLRRVADEVSNNFIKIQNYKIVKSSAHFHFERFQLFYYGIEKALCESDSYGKHCLFKNTLKVVPKNVLPNKMEGVDLTTLRVLILCNVANNMLKLTNPVHQDAGIVHVLSINTKSSSLSDILCGPVINEFGVKDTTNIADNFFDKRTSDMRMMAQHRYRVNIKPTSEWKNYFSKLGRGSVTLELLANKPSKSIKLILNDLSGANKGPSFIFYNCARLCVLLKEFENKVTLKDYPPLPDIKTIDFAVLNQKEEWELFYVFVLQYPLLIKNCIKDIDKGMFNPHYLITFLSNLSSIFSVYYRRVRILTNPREHLFAIIHARIYLLKALQQIFYNALSILNIEPIEEM